MTKIALEVFETALVDACAYLYANDKHLVTEHAHERTIVADCIAPFLRNRFTGWVVNTEYNREGTDRDSKRDLDNKILVPDIIVHKYGPKGPNVGAIQVKGFWNPENRTEDSDKLRRLRAKHGYTFLYRVELGEDSCELIRVL